MKWNIVTDSSCDLLPSEEPGQICLASVPFVISVGSEDFVDDEQLDTARLLRAMEQCPEASHTSCPPPQAWREAFESADCAIALTISAQLSGSMASAMIARELVLEQHPQKRIAVIDSHSTGPEIALCVKQMQAWIRDGADFDEVVARAQRFFEEAKILFALNSFDNLVKNGRMSRLTVAVARVLNMWGIGSGSAEGKIVLDGKTRGARHMIEQLVGLMRERGFQGGRVAISHCDSPALATALSQRIQELWKSTEVRILPTRGLCSYYAERGGLIVGFA